jgi:phosphoribosylformylglycinamidine cyclo-ligase
MDANTYSSAGVDVAKAEHFVERLKSRSKRVGHEKLWKAAGGYASVVPIDDDLAMALTTDGVGTKLLVALEFHELTGIGIDLVAMCANDLICVGATPTSFLDYFATGKLDDNQADRIMEGIVEGCDRAGMLLVGGETAELPGLYSADHFDLAGFAAGTVRRKNLLTGDGIKPGDTLIGVASTGIHSNGLSLARKLFPPGHSMRKELLVPTAIYVKPAMEALCRYGQAIKGIVHITGGGWRNLLRLNPEVGFKIDSPLPLPQIFEHMLAVVNVEEMCNTFNMGMGLAIMAESHHAQIIQLFAEHGFTAAPVGEVTDVRGTVDVNTTWQKGSKKHLTLTGKGKG